LIAESLAVDAAKSGPPPVAPPADVAAEAVS
jgi:hypothetical protein